MLGNQHKALPGGTTSHTSGNARLKDRLGLLNGRPRGSSGTAGASACSWRITRRWPVPPNSLFPSSHFRWRPGIRVPAAVHSSFTTSPLWNLCSAPFCDSGCKAAAIAHAASARAPHCSRAWSALVLAVPPRLLRPFDEPIFVHDRCRGLRRGRLALVW